MIGFIGGGNMAEALIKGMAGKAGGEVMVSEPSERRREHLGAAYGVKAVFDNPAMVSACRIIVLAVKPQQMAAVLDEIAPAVTEDKTVVSIAAGVTLSFLQDRLRTRRLIRVMPNVASMVQEGMAVMSLCECFSDADMGAVRDIFMSSGRVLVLPEKHMNAVTALSGSGPAFIAGFLDLMVKAAVELGLGEHEALELGTQTLIGTGRLIDSGIAPERLVEMVKSPGGTTEAGMGVFAGAGLEKLVRKAMEAAARRAEELSR